MSLFNPDTPKEIKVVITAGILGFLGLMIWLIGQTIYNDFPHPDNVNYNCVDFSTQQDAQLYFKGQGGSKTSNVDNLDGDHNGIACDGHQKVQ